MPLRNLSFQCGKATVTVREPKGIDRVDNKVVYRKLTFDRTNELEINRVVQFTDMLLQTVSIEGEFEYPWASSNSDIKTTQAAYEGWLDWSDSVMALWTGSLALVAAPPGDVATQPDIEKNV